MGRKKLKHLPPERLYGFSPDAERAALIDQNVRENLADSLDSVFAELGDTLDINADRWLQVRAAIKRGPVSPRLVATYSDLIEAIYSDDVVRAHPLAQAVLSEHAREAKVSILTLSDEDLGAAQAARYARYALAESEGWALSPISVERKLQLAEVFSEVVALLDKADASLLAEIQSLIGEVVFVQGADSNSNGFGGATTFYLWGAMLLNATRITDRISLATAVIHEAAHAFLFGVNLGGRLTDNPDEDICASPLRADFRPVEGVFHATFVLARMIYGLDSLLASDRLTKAEATTALNDLKAHRHAFHEGVASLSKTARLTPAGERLLSGAIKYVEERSSIVCRDTAKR